MAQNKKSRIDAKAKAARKQTFDCLLDIPDPYPITVPTKAPGSPVSEEEHGSQYATMPPGQLAAAVADIFDEVYKLGALIENELIKGNNLGILKPLRRKSF